MAPRRVRSFTRPTPSIRFKHAGATAAVGLAAALGLAACGGTPANPVGESPRPTGAPSSSTAAEPWDLLYLSDSTGWNVAEEYQRLAAQQLGRTVRLIDARAPNRQIGDDLRWINAHTAEVASAEIVVVWGGPVGSGVKDTLANACFSLRNPGAVTQEDWAPFGAKIGEVLDAVWAARQGQPTVLRVTDIYVPVLRDWAKAGIREECTASNEAMSAVVRQAAESHGATMVSTYDALNGTDHGDDPGTRGLISGDGVHLSHAGGVVVANALAATGFEPTTAPS